FTGSVPLCNINDRKELREQGSRKSPAERLTSARSCITQARSARSCKTASADSRQGVRRLRDDSRWSPSRRRGWRCARRTRLPPEAYPSPLPSPHDLERGEMGEV